MIHRSILQFPSGTFKLTGQWDGPESAGGPLPGVIFCHGFTGNRFESRRVFARLSAWLAEQGIWTFRFDHRGCGESQGDFIDFSPEGMLEDLRSALKVFLDDPRVDTSRTAVVGYSLGGLSASYMLHLHPEFVTASMWAPVARPEIIRARLSTYPGFDGYKERGYFDYGGSRVSAEYIDGVGNFRPVDWAVDYPKPILFAQAEGDQVVKPEQVRMYLEARQNPGDELLMIPGGDHFFGAADNIDRLLSTAGEWLLRHLRG